MSDYNILEFMGFEQQNLLVSFANLKGEIGFLKELDEIYQETKDAFPASKSNDTHVMVGLMFLRAHSELYIGMSQFLKSHLSKGFLSLRIAIEAAFYAYYFTKYPEQAKDYIDEKSPLQKQIFWRIKDHIAKNAKDFPMAQSLVKIHEVASNFSAHPSFPSLIYKYQHIVTEGQKKEEIKLNYFDGLSFEDFLSYYFGLLKGYFMVFQLFYGCFYKKEFKIEYPDREKRIATYEAKLNLKHKQYPLKGRKSADK